MSAQAYDGRKGLLTADRTDLATRLLVSAFGATPDAIKAQVSVGQLFKDACRLGGFRYRPILGSDAEAVEVEALVAECCLYWEWSRLAARLGHGTGDTANHRVYLLRAGWTALGELNSLSSVHSAIAAVQR